MSASQPRRARPALATLVVLFALYLAFVVWAVLWKLHAPYISDDPSHALKLVPFVSTKDAGRSAPREVVANIALFAPLGAYLRVLRPGMSWAAIGAAAAVLSSSLEAVQFFTGAGVADISDVISNTGGALIGAVLAALLQAVLPRRAAAVMLVVAVLTTGVVASAIALRGADAGLSPGLPDSASGSLLP